VLRLTDCLKCIGNASPFFRIVPAADPDVYTFLVSTGTVSVRYGWFTLEP